MKENKITTYLLYAIGEIVLVVVGILIAVSIDDWNQANANDQAARKIAESIKSNLEQDLIAIDSTLRLLNSKLAPFDSLQAKLNAEHISKSEVVYLIKNEFDPMIVPFLGFSDITYRSAVSSGKIELLNDRLKETLYEHYLYQEAVMDVFKTYDLLYVEAVSEFIAHFPLQNSFVTFNKGYVYERKWQNPDFDLLTTLFNAAGTTKRNYYRMLNDQLSNAKRRTTLLIQTLEDQ